MMALLRSRGEHVFCESTYSLLVIFGVTRRMMDRTCFRVAVVSAPKTRSELLRRVWRGFRRRRDGFLKTVGYENAGYGHSAEGKRNIETGFGRED
jgi:hypothetical protein